MQKHHLRFSSILSSPRRDFRGFRQAARPGADPSSHWWSRHVRGLLYLLSTLAPRAQPSGARTKACSVCSYQHPPPKPLKLCLASHLSAAPVVHRLHLACRGHSAPMLSQLPRASLLLSMSAPHVLTGSGALRWFKEMFSYILPSFPSCPQWRFGPKCPDPPEPGRHSVSRENVFY